MSQQVYSRLDQTEEVRVKAQPVGTVIVDRSQDLIVSGRDGVIQEAEEEFDVMEENKRVV